MTGSETIHRYAKVIKGTSIGLIVLSAIVLLRLLPVGDAVDVLIHRVADLGVWGLVVFALVYVAAAVLFIPGSALTLAAGAVFGLAWGVVTVSLASTTAAALAFLIARYLARDKVARQAQRYPKFQAIDAAIGRRGWKIIALLRLSPAVPFSLGNYLFGLTAIRFWPYVLSSWLAMLPGTFLYIYLGRVGREGLAVAADASTGKSPVQWAMLFVGLLATIVVTLYVTRIARKSIREITRIDQPMNNSELTTSTEPIVPTASYTPPVRWPWSVTILAMSALLITTTAACAYVNRSALQGLFRTLIPVALTESYADKPGGPTFDHILFDQLLRKHVDQHGWVDYNALGREADKLDQYLAALADAPFAEMDRSEKLAFLINAYNAFTLRLILDHQPIESIKDIPSGKRWDARRWRVGSYIWSLNQIEHEQIRPNFIEPRIHFALVCAAVGCPKLRNEAYRADRIEAQLEDQARYVHTHDRWFRYEAGGDVVLLTKLYDWYGGDFAQTAGSVLQFAATYSDDLKHVLDAGKAPRIQWLDYDWKLNDKRNVR